MSLRSDIMRFSVLGFRSDIRIELQAPVVILIKNRAGSPKIGTVGRYLTHFLGLSSPIMDMVKLVGLVNFQKICIYLLDHGSGQHVQLVSSGPTLFRTCHNFIFTCPRSLYNYLYHI